MPEGFVSWELPNEAARNSISLLLPSEVGNLCFQFGDSTYWRLVSIDPAVWEKVEV